MVIDARQRIDKWLFFSRAVKSRSLAAKLVVAGRVRINRDKAAQASDLVRAGDVLTITLERRIFVWRVLGTGSRRGPAEEARLLYQDISPPPTPKGEAVRDAIPAPRDAGSGRPTKKQRRETDRLLGDD
ncbi:MAG: RNA-binding S4 domain-containing protein [Mesorhizobium sp.]|uniref:RNA-binding S4 domain-containing protein n=1 Tax=Mesorhizobium sp. TaxID=1871066 RepID=UPI000FE63C89|nr:RNA-binding S4 domain-containing protein [Mesorhizobium sp.]RWM88494.1 MAG: RNA-binding S4 domain-containing protein [Mesorhizobium sp.]